MTARFDGIERETGPAPVASVLWLHGLGADAGDFVPILPELVDPRWPPLRFIFPNAPVRPVTLNGGMAMRAWFDLYGMDLASCEDEAGVRAAIALLDGLIERELARGIRAERILLAGFSQGGAIAMATMLRRPTPLAGAVLLSTWLPLAAHSAVEATAASSATPVFMAHGAHDPMVPQAWAMRSADFLRARGHPLQWHSYPMGHAVCAEEIADLAAWFTHRVGGWR
jgi:phospholipase/carboxylesterase